MEGVGGVTGMTFPQRQAFSYWQGNSGIVPLGLFLHGPGDCRGFFSAPLIQLNVRRNSGLRPNPWWESLMELFILKL